MSSVASYLTRNAQERPDAVAIIHPRGRRWNGERKLTTLTYRELEERSDRIARGLVELGLRRGTHVALMLRPSPELFAVVFAMFKAGIVPVLIDPGIGIRHLKKCLDEAEPQAMIGGAQAHLARALLGWARDSIRLRIRTGSVALPGHVSLEEVEEFGLDSPPLAGGIRSSDKAAIIFTSGSTGLPKGVVYTHAHFSAQVELIRQTYGIQPGEVDLPTFPLFAIFDPALGMTTVIPEMDPTRPARANPKKIISAIQDFGVTHMFGSPALLNRVGRYGAVRGIQLPSLRRALSAGAPVPAAVLERFGRMLAPGAQVFTPYGATESLPVASIESAEVLQETRHRSNQGAGTCVGRPIEGMQVRIIPITDAPVARWEESLALPTGEIGEIAVKGPVVTREYFGRPEATDAAKIADPAGGFYHRMGDLGYFDEQGRLWFCGRKSHRVITDSQTLFTIPCEGVFNAHPAVFRTALVGVPAATRESSPAQEPDRTLPVLCVELEDKRAGRRELARLRAELLEIASRHTHTQAISRILFHPSFPVDIRHNSKIFREKLAHWARKEIQV